jgi:Bacterial type II/III secretion system short domain
MNVHRLLIPGLILLAAGLSRQAEGQASPAPKAAEPSREEFVAEKGFSSRVFEVRHREPGDLASVVRPLGSGFRGATVSFNREFRTITVRDFPENVAAIEAALKRLDVPEAVRPDVELRLWVLVASGSAGAGEPFPDDLKEAVAALKSTLAYRSYALAGSFVQRVRDGARGIHGEGVTDLGVTGVNGKANRPMQLEYHIGSLSLDPAGTGPAAVKLDAFSLSLVGDGRAQLKTDATLREGEKVVLGTSTVRDRALVVVVSGRVIR